MTDYHQLRDLRSDLRDCKTALEQAERDRDDWRRRCEKELNRIDRLDNERRQLRVELEQVKKARDEALQADKETDQSD